MRILPQLSMNGIYWVFIVCFLLTLPFLGWIRSYPKPRSVEDQTKTKNRLLIFLSIFALTIILTIFLFKTLRNNVLYFYSPSEIKENGDIKFNKNIRIGGMVKKNTLEINNQEIKFIITDFKNEISVSFKGTIPNLFAEGKGVVAEGMLKDKRFFEADRILAKHDENYMPPELKNILSDNAE